MSTEQGPANSEIGIRIPRFTDDWKKKLVILFVSILVTSLFVQDSLVKYGLAIVAAYVIIMEKELRYRSLLINIMDNQLIKVSRQVDVLECELAKMEDKISGEKKS